LRIASKAKVAAARRRVHERMAADGKVETHDMLTNSDLGSALDEEVQRLPQRYRTALVLCCLQCKSTDEAARELGCPRGTVGTWVARARALLRARLTRRGFALSAGLLAGAIAQAAAVAVPPSLARSAIQAGVRSAAGLVPGLVPLQVVTLAQGELQTMSLTRLTRVFLFLLTLGAAGTGATFLAAQTAGAGKTAPAAQSKPAIPAGQAKAPQPAASPGQQKAAQDLVAVRIYSQKNLHDIGKAMHKFADKQFADKQVHELPTAALRSKDGKPLLSWRVALLPYLGEEALYKQFKLDEPWDSPHNKKLLAKMPRVYAAPTGKAAKPGMTFYQVFAGPGALFDGATRISYEDLINDGRPTGSLAMVAEAAEAVPWTKPADLPFDANKALPRLGGILDGNFNVLAADGFVHYAKTGFDQQRLRTAILRARTLDANLLNSLNP
jgi:hypothetical protein